MTEPPVGTWVKEVPGGNVLSHMDCTACDKCHRLTNGSCVACGGRIQRCPNVVAMYKWMKGHAVCEEHIDAAYRDMMDTIWNQRGTAGQ